MKEEFNHKHYNYTWTKGFGIAILLAFVLLVGSVYAQVVSGSPNTPSGYSIDSQTGNLISNGSISSVSGWTVTTGGPTWTPVSPGGSFSLDGYTFGYGVESLGQSPSVNLSSFNHGYLNSSAVFVTGFSYGLSYRFPCANSIGTNCDGTAQAGFTANPTQDNLRVEVGYYPSTGSPTFYTHQLGLKNINDGNSPYNPSWQTLSQTVTFAGAKPLAQAGAVNYEIIGSDQGFWACNPGCYGPQVKDAFIKANYSVDPCILNPAFNPSCPGFSNIIQGALSPLYVNNYNIATTLPHIGGGVQLHGFDYGFNWSNYGECYNRFLFWCTDWRTDGGATINFRITDKNNNVLFVDSQYRAGNNQSGSYANRYLFTETQNSLNMGNVEWYLTGLWNHLAVTGWTKPIWTPDPCYFNGLYSPNCTNFQDTLKQVMADIKAQQDKIAAQNASVTSSSSSTTPNSTITITVEADSTNPTVSVITNSSPVQSTNSINTTALATQSSSNNLSSTLTRSNSRSETNSDSNNLALALVRQNQQRESSLTMQASQNAIRETEQNGIRAIRQAEQTAFEAVTKSQDTQQKEEQSQVTDAILSVSRTEQTLGAGPAPGSTSVVTQAIQQRTQQAQAVQEPQPVINSTSTSAVVQFNAMATTVVQPVQMFNPLQPPVFSNPITASAVPYQPPVQTQSSDNRLSESSQQRELTTSSNQTFALLPPQAVTSEVQQTAITTTTVLPVTQVDLPQTQANFLNDKTNPINSILEARTVMPEQERNSTNTQQVKSNVQDNDAAAGVSIDSIARTPVGFNSYMVALSDANFYAPKEIYRNQKNVDNARALRQLASDRLHQQMVDQQYLPR